MSPGGSARACRADRRGLRVAALLVLLAGCAAEPAGRTEVRTVQGVDLTHTNVVEQIGEGSPDIVVTASDAAVAGVLAEHGLRLYFCRRDAENFTKVIMGTAGSPTRFLASIPHQPRGTWVDYYIEVRGAGGELLTFPGTAGAGIYYSLRFKGRPPLIVSSLHTLAMILALLFFLFAGYRGWRFVSGGGSYGVLETCTRYGLAALFVGGLPLGVLTAYYTIGTTWDGVLPGSGATDAATLLLLLYWIIVVGLFRTSRSDGPAEEASNAAEERRRRRYARLVIAGAILTLLAYAVPQSI